MVSENSGNISGFSEFVSNLSDNILSELSKRVDIVFDTDLFQSLPSIFLNNLRSALKDPLVDTEIKDLVSSLVDRAGELSLEKLLTAFGYRGTNDITINSDLECLDELDEVDSVDDEEIYQFLTGYYYKNTTGYRLLYITETSKSDEFLKNIADNFLEDSDEIKSFIRVLGPDKVKNCHGHVKSCRELLAAKSINTGNTMKELIQLEFTQGKEVITRPEVKARLLKVYSNNSIDKSTATASDILKYFEVEESTSSIVDPGTGQKKRVRVYKIGCPK